MILHFKKNLHHLHVRTVPLDGSYPTSSDDLDVLPKQLSMKAMMIKSKNFQHYIRTKLFFIIFISNFFFPFIFSVNVFLFLNIFLFIFDVIFYNRFIAIIIIIIIVHDNVARLVFTQIC